MGCSSSLSEHFFWLCIGFLLHFLNLMFLRFLMFLRLISVTQACWRRWYRT